MAAKTGQAEQRARSSVLVSIIEDISLCPVLGPAADAKDFFLAVGGGADDSVETSIDNHFFADEAGDSVDGLASFIDPTVNEPPRRLTPARAALMMAFCSAWTLRQSS